MQHRLALCALPLGLAAAWPAAAWSPLGEVVCAPRPALVERLEARQGARLQASGLRDGDTLIEVWSDDRGRWTLVQSYAGGASCIVAMGEGWDMTAPPPT